MGLTGRSKVEPTPTFARSLPVIEEVALLAFGRITWSRSPKRWDARPNAGPWIHERNRDVGPHPIASKAYPDPATATFGTGDIGGSYTGDEWMTEPVPSVAWMVTG